MSTGVALLVFLGSLALSVVSSVVLANLLDKVGNRFQLAEGLVGIVTALAADSPEIAAAVTRLPQAAASWAWASFSARTSSTSLRCWDCPR